MRIFHQEQELISLNFLCVHNSALTTRRITPFTARENFTVYDTAIFYCQQTRQVFFCLRGAFTNGARYIGYISPEYRPSFDVMLQSSLNANGAHVSTDGEVVLYENTDASGIVIVSGMWTSDAS